MPRGVVTNMEALITTQEISDRINDGQSKAQIIAWLQEEKNMTWGSAKNLYYNTLKEMVPDDAYLAAYKKSLATTNMSRLERIVEDSLSGNTADKAIALKAIDQLNKMCGAYADNNITIAQQNKDGDGQIIQIRFGE